MKKRLLPLTLAITLLLPAAVVVRAADEKPVSKDEKSAHKEADTELGKVMEKLNNAWRKLRKQAPDAANNASSLELVATIKAESENALKFQPDKAKDLPEADRPKYVEGYQTKMKEFNAKLDKLTAAFNAGDNPGAVAIIKELGQLQREGHKEYKRPDK
jgi:soluble cytochrome b562